MRFTDGSPREASSGKAQAKINGRSEVGSPVVWEIEKEADDQMEIVYDVTLRRMG